MNEAQLSDGDLDLVHNVVLTLLRRGQSVKNICFLLTEELEKVSDASVYIQAMHEADFAP